MKVIISLSSLALVSLSNFAPCFAAQQSLSQSSAQPLPSQSLPSSTKPIQVAGFFDIIHEVRDIVKEQQTRADQQAKAKKEEQDRLERKAEAEKKEEQDRLERRAEADRKEQERQQRLEAAQKAQDEHRAAVAAQREAEQKRLDSMTPEQKNAYIEQKKAREIEQFTMWSTLFGAMFGGGNSAASSQSEHEKWQNQRDKDLLNEQRRNQQSTPQPAPAPVQPIGGSGGIFGNGPGGSFYGH